VLSDTQQRREYNLKLRKAGAEAHELEHVQRVLRAATAFQKAEVLMKRNNLAQAEVHAKQALADDPDQADHVALVAWIESQKPEPDVKALIKDLDRAITMQPNNLRAHWYRGQLQKRIGKDARAIQDFRFIVERDPRHTDAVRELRLYQIRRASSGVSSYPPGTPSARPSPMPPSDKSKGEGGSGGIISKFFKR
jgi:tetratricopeptide (TPR) repeat protein